MVMIETMKLITKPRVIFWAILLCTIWVLFYALVMHLQVGAISFWVALIASANYNYLFGFVSILIWLLCKKIPFDQTNKILFFSLHFLAAIFCSALWLFISYGFWYLSEGERIFEQVDVRGIIGWQFLFGMIQCFFVAGIFYTIIYHRDLKQKEIEQAELKILTRDAELKALKLQMNPHFLFNSLNSINALVTKNPALARKMISQLSELLRMSLESHDKLLIPLKEELDLVHTYLSIEQMRFGDKMVVREEIDPELLTRPFPAMLLQPLLENAVKYGIANTRTGGTISLSIQKQDRFLIGSVINESNDTNLKVPSSISNNGISLHNIRQRLDRMYSENYSWQIDVSEPNKFKVEFKLSLLG
jgi:two-component system LytT family sensor kinase